MIIAITSNNDLVFQHFGKCQEFTVFETEDERVVSKIKLKRNPDCNKNVVDFLKEQKIDLVICGNIGSGAKIALVEKRIEYICGVTGDVMEALIAYLSGLNIGNPDCICTNFSEVLGNGCTCGLDNKK